MIFKRLFDSVLNYYIQNPIDLINLGDSEGELNYLRNMGPSYVRTWRDINSINFGKDKKDVRILEIGSYLGFVSLGLKNSGFSVSTADLPLFMKNERLQKLYRENGIEFHMTDLADKLPFDNESFDCVVLCETLEHLNFNPVPVIAEIKRIISKNGILYVSVPNLVRLENRLKIIRGNSCHNSMDDFFAQMDPEKNFSVGLHWREYTIGEIKELLEKSGFNIQKAYFFTLLDVYKLKLKFYFRAMYVYKNFRYILFRLKNSLKENITIISQKR